MRSIGIALWLCGVAGAASLHYQESGFAAGAPGWTAWSARAETAPRTFVDPLRYRTRTGSLAISGNSNLAEHGGWERRVDGVTPGAWYRFVAYYRAEAVPAESWQVVARLDWRGASGGRGGVPGYGERGARRGGGEKGLGGAQGAEKAAGVAG